MITKKSIIYTADFKKNYPYFDRWRYMNRVCYDQRKREYKTHGKKGIYVCKQWRYNKNQPIVSKFNLSQYRNFEKWLVKNYSKVIDKEFAIVTRKNPYKPYDTRNTIVAFSNQSNSRRSVFKNSVFSYKNKRFYALDMCYILGRYNSSGRGLVKLINKRYNGSVKVWLENWEKSKYKYLREKSKYYKLLIESAIRNKTIFIIK